MNEWVMILALNIIGPGAGEIRDVSLTTLGGFASKATCDAAAQTLAERTIAVIGRARMQRGIQGNSMNSIPSLNHECVQIRK
jgi:hypothetical protein